ncbi:MAG: alpha-E domain-containing protein, partial [Planctomycetaceae bacterium]|nr:alpha-E domain-containing protein [Planctomycetaceae bacterium]
IECGADAGDVWPSLVNVSGDQEWFYERYGLATADSVTHFLTFNEEYPNSIRNCVRTARENARSIRETISSEMWEQLNQFHIFIREASGNSQWRQSPQDFFQEVKQQSHLFKGLTDSTLRRGDGWNFGRLGRLLERADKTSRLLDVKYYILLPRVDHVNSSVDDLQWQAVLRSVSAFEMYRQQHHGITPPKVVEFLVLDRLFPRAIHYAVLEAEKALHAITGTPLDTFGNAAEQQLGLLRSELAYATVDEIIAAGLHEYLDGLQTKLNRVGDGIYETFITTTPATERQSQRQSQQG